MKHRKMSRSSGDFVTLQMLIDEGHSPLAFRYLTYLAHYRAHLTFSEEALAGAEAGLKGLHELFAALPPPPAPEGAPGAPAGSLADAPDEASLALFRDALRDDLNAPKALAAVWRVARDRELSPPVRRATLLEMNALLPLGLESVAPAPEAEGEASAPEEVAELARQREAARKARDFATADALRKRLTELGWEVRDTPRGPELRRGAR
jgi:cysteinyl-tRNA synthetase